MATDDGRTPRRFCLREICATSCPEAGAGCGPTISKGASRRTEARRGRKGFRRKGTGSRSRRLGRVSGLPTATARRRLAPSAVVGPHTLRQASLTPTRARQEVSLCQTGPLVGAGPVRGSEIGGGLAPGYSTLERRRRRGARRPLRLD